MSYTSDERDAAVSGLVKGTLSFSRDRLGPRDVNSSFAEAQELVNTTLLYETDAIFYLVYLASNRLRRLVQAELDTIDELLDAVDDLLQPNRPVQDVSGAADAEAALIALEGAMSRRGGVSAQEYSRYTSSLKRLTDELARTTKHTYVPRGSSTAVTDVVRPEAQAKLDTRTAMDQLVKDHAAMLAGVDRILIAYDDFVALDIGAAVAEKQISRARESMAAIKDSLESLTPEQRIAEARTSLLGALANRGLVKGVAQVPAPGNKKVYQQLSAAAKYRISSSGEGSAPSVTGTLSAPFKISGTAKNLALEMNGGGALTFDLLPSGASFQAGIKQASLTGGIPGPFVIRADEDTPGPIYTGDTGSNYGLTAGTDDKLYVAVDGQTYEVDISVTSSGTPTEVSDAINGTSGLSDVVTAAVVAGESSGNRVRISYDYTTPANKPASYSDRRMAIVPGAQSDPSKFDSWRVNSDILAGTSTPKVTGWDGNNSLRVKANDDTDNLQIDLPVGSYPDYEVSAATVASAIDTAGGTEFNSSATSDNRILINSTRYGEGSIITMTSYETGLRSSGDRAGLMWPSHAGLATLGFLRHQEDRQRDIDGRTVTNLLNTNSSFKAQATATMERVEYLSARQATKQAAGADPGHVKMDVPVETNPLANWPDAAELKVEVNNGDNRGIYDINSLNWSGGVLEVEVKNRNFRDTNTDYLYSLTVFRERLVITSKNRSTTGSLEVVVPGAGNDARATLGLPTGAVASTVSKVLVEVNDPSTGWKPIDLRALGVKVNDELVQEDTNTTLTAVSGISEGRSGLLTVSPEVPAALSLTNTEGFFIRSAAAMSHDSFIEQLQLWKDLTLPPYQDDIASIDRLLSPILLIKASPGKVNQAYDVISGLRGKLAGSGSLSEVLASFSVAMINDVEDILQALKERGYDRALEVLVNGEPAKFPGMTSTDASYGRAAMSAMSEIAKEDINETKTNKSQFEDVHQRLRSESYDDKNPINDFSDIESLNTNPEALELWAGMEE